MCRLLITLERVNLVHHPSLCLPETLKVGRHLERSLILHKTHTQDEFCFAERPGKVLDFKVTDSTYTNLSLSWTKPKEVEGVEDEAKGYFVEIRPAENTEWDRCNSNFITMTSYTVKGLKSMAMYWVRAIATNDGGEGEPQELDNYILAMPPPGKINILTMKLILSQTFWEYYFESPLSLCSHSVLNCISVLVPDHYEMSLVLYTYVALKIMACM